MQVFKATVASFTLVSSSIMCAYYSPIIFASFCIILGALLWYITRNVGIAKIKQVLDHVLRFMLLPADFRETILNLIPWNESTVSVMPAHIYNPPVTKFGTPPNLSYDAVMNRSQSGASESLSPTSSPSSKMTLTRGGSSPRERSNLTYNAFHMHSKPQLSRNVSPSKRPGSFFAAPRDRPVGVKTCHAVAGPTLASTRFKQNLDYCVYADVNSPGFTERIASYHQEANSETPSSGYTSPGQFPSVKLAKDNVRIVTMKNRPKPYVPVTVRIAPPITDHTSPTRFERPREEKRETPTQSVLDALKEISRKRIHGEVEETDPNKRYKGNGQEASTSSADDTRAGVGEVGNKRGRDGSPEKRPSSAQLPFAKRVCSNEIASSLSSIQRFKDKKRKAAAVAITSPSPGPSACKKKIALTVDDVEYDLTTKSTSTGIQVAKKLPSLEINATPSKEMTQTEPKTLLTPVAESSQPLRPLFGKPTSPEINTTPKDKRSPVFATMQTEKTSSAELTSRQLRQKKLQRLFNAIKKDELEAKAEKSASVSVKEPTPSAPAASLVSSTLLTTAITSPVVSTAQQDVLAQLGISNASSTSYKSNTGVPVAPVISTPDIIAPQKKESSSPPYSFGSALTNVSVSSTSTLSSPILSLTTLKPGLPPATSPFAGMPGLSSIVLPTPSTASPTIAATSATPSTLSSSLGLPPVSTPTSLSFMKNITILTPKIPSSSSEQTIGVTLTTGAANFGSLSFGASQSTPISPATVAPQLGPPPAYGSLLSLPTSASSIKLPASSSSLANPDNKQSGFGSTSTPTFGTSSSTLPAFGSTSSSSPFTSAPPAYSSTAALNTSNVSPYTSNSSSQPTFGIASKPVDTAGSAPATFGTSPSPFHVTATPQQSFGSVNIPGTTSGSFNALPIALATNSATPQFGSSTTPNQTSGFGTETFTFGGQKTVEPPSYGTSTSTNSSQVPTASGPGFSFGSTPNTSNNIFPISSASTTEASGLYQFGQTATSTTPNTFGQPSSTTFGSTPGTTPSFGGQTSVNSSPFGQSGNTPTAFGQVATASPFGQTGTTAPASSTAPAFGQDVSNTSNKPLFGGFTFGDPVPTSTAGEFGSTNNKPGMPNIFGAPPNQSPFQQSSISTPAASSLSLSNFAATSNAIGGFSFPTNLAASTTVASNSSAFAFGSSAPTETTGFNFNAPASKPAESFGFTSPQQQTFAFGSQQQQTAPAYGSDPNAISTPTFGQGSSGGTFQFNASTAQQQPQAQAGGMFSIGAGAAANRSRSAAGRRRKN